MVFSYINSKGEKYYLHSKLGIKNKAKIYYFSKIMSPHNKEDTLPEGREIIEHPITKMPLLRSKEKKVV